MDGSVGHHAVTERGTEKVSAWVSWLVCQSHSDTVSQVSHKASQREILLVEKQGWSRFTVMGD